MELTLPFEARHYQEPFLNHMLGGGLRAVLVWHRRAGKDLSAWTWTILAALQRVGTYHYMLPTYGQGRKIIWNGIDGHGRRFRDYLPGDLITNTHDTDMRIHLSNGSVIQVVGSDSVDSLVGTNPVGVVLSEYAIQNPRGWEYYTPILRENKGWAVFAYTPRGDNHGHKLYQSALKLNNWFVSKLSILDTGILADSDLDEDRAIGIPEEVIQQEYYCSFSMTNAGAYFGKAMDRAEREGRIGNWTYDPRLPVHTAWDFGVNDSTAIWFLQLQGNEPWFIDYFEMNSEGLPYYAKELKRRDWLYGGHLAPHDVNVREFGSGVTRLETAAGLGISFEPVTRLSKDSQIHAVHLLLPRARFNIHNCSSGIDALRAYERKWDSVNKVFLNKPDHNWASHCADALMTCAVGIDRLDNSMSDPTETGYSGRRQEYDDFAVGI